MEILAEKQIKKLDEISLDESINGNEILEIPW